MSRRRATLVTLVGTFANTAIVTAQAVVLIPVYMQHIGPRLYGAWLGSGDFLVWLQAFDLGLVNLMIQRVGAAHARRDRKAVGDWFGSGVAILAAVSAAIFVLGIGLSRYLPGWMGLVGEEARTLRACFGVGVAAAAVSLFNNAFVGLSRGIQRTGFLNGSVVAGSLVGFVCSYVLVRMGFGLWAITWGLVARAAVCLAGSLLFTFFIARQGAFASARPSWSVLREYAFTSPATALGGLSYSIMNQSETAAVALLLGPEMAATYGVTRKAGEVLRGLLDTIAFASYGGFSHLIASEERGRAADVHEQIIGVRTVLAVAGAAALAASNGSLIGAWVGPSHYAGDLLTGAFALQDVIVGGSFLLNYLYRATGQVVRGSLMLCAEGFVRIPLMGLLVVTMGPVGAPVASIATAVFAGGLAWRATRHELGASSGWWSHSRCWVARVCVLAAGIGVGLVVEAPSWRATLLSAGGVGFAGMAALLASDARLLTWVRRRSTAPAATPIAEMEARSG